MRVRSLAVAAVAATALLAGCSGGDGLPASSTVGYVEGDGSYSEIPAAERTTTITLSGTTAEGTTVDLSTLRGKPVVLNLWFADCAPCRTEAPALEQVAQEYAGRASFVGINTGRDDADRVVAFQKTHGVTYPSLLDDDGSALLALRGVAPRATPTTVVLDADGKVAAQYAGEITATILGELIDGALDTGTPA
ncbi:TlpA family protein disulfide reductase [Kineococcus rubinsiae]|uniref:TlpA family protein disulfide reductase n=1 Tax=Kineococcus rubinsiae TaxID=2609562 RepID=UPI001431A125|nr:TlpA disulfide reductase family protein [Kineococcus rubinsiae]NIZ92645.1 TlpA family protein disulfide reductase [Kineococcus rubinsiae]